MCCKVWPEYRKVMKGNTKEEMSTCLKYEIYTENKSCGNYKKSMQLNCSATWSKGCWRFIEAVFKRPNLVSNDHVNVGWNCLDFSAANVAEIIKLMCLTKVHS